VARPRYGRAKETDSGPASIVGHRHGSRTRSLTGSFGKTEITVPRARLQTSEGGTTEWHSKALRAYQRRTLTADALIASAYLAGTNTRRVRRALAALFRGAVSKDIVSRVWRKIKSDWDAWNARSLAPEPIVGLILDGTSSASGSIARPLRSRCSWLQFEADRAGQDSIRINLQWRICFQWPRGAVGPSKGSKIKRFADGAFRPTIAP